MTAFPLFSQISNGAGNGANSGANSPASDAVFVINALNCNIKGRTRPDALLRAGDFKKGEEIKGRENFEKYIQEKTQQLVNQRVLAKAQIDYTIGDLQADGKYPVDLFINVEDTWNIIALPYPKYDSNTGFELIIKARDYNFLGTMNPLRLDLGYNRDKNGRNTLMLALDSDFPFKAFGYNWNFNFDHFFNYRPGLSRPYNYKNITSLSVELPFKTSSLNLGFEETFNLNTENPDQYKADYGEFQTIYMSSKLYSSWRIPTGLHIFEFGELAYTPNLSATINYTLPNDTLADFRRGPSVDLGHSLGFGRVNWIGNYRSGLNASLSNSFKYNFHRTGQDENALEISYSAAGVGYFVIADSFGISSNIQFRHWINHDSGYTETGGVLRGILDSAVHANYILSLNLDFPFRVLQFQPSKWFNTSKLRFFDFDMQLSPIIDMAFYHDPSKDNPLPATSRIILDGGKNMLITGGFEVIEVPAFMRSLYLRASLAWNFVEQVNNPGGYYLNPILPIIPHLPDGNNQEIFVGIGHHY
jgi:hypothetical protein